MTAATPDEINARRAARRLQEHWAARGYPSVKATVHKFIMATGEPAWGVRSNLVNGLPPDFKGTAL